MESNLTSLESRVSELERKVENIDSIKESIVPEYITAIKTIWEDYYTITEKDISFLSIPARSSFSGLMYGVYCGPFTDPIYYEGYKDNKSYGNPIDSLDFLCMLHDTFFCNPKSDDLFLKSISVLGDNNMIKNGNNSIGISRMIRMTRVLFGCYRKGNSIKLS
jgi:hypothetical protein